MTIIVIDIKFQFDNMAEPRHRKLASMGIASWASTGRPEVLDRLHTEIFNIWLDVFGEIKEALADQSADGTRLVSLPRSFFIKNDLLLILQISTDHVLEGQFRTASDTHS